jgi:Mce-associated membrane protein
VIGCFFVQDPERHHADHSDAPADVTDADESQPRSRVDPSDMVPESVVDPEGEVAEAEARAEAARARLERLREAAETGDTDGDTASQDAGQRTAKSIRARLRLPGRPGRPRWLRRPGRKAIAAGVGILLASASVGASGYMVWQHRTTVHKQRLTAEFAAAARQGVTSLMSIDTNHARDDIQRILDGSTGDLKNQLSAMSGLMAKQAEESKVSSKATVEAVAVESLSDDSAVVLVAARSDVTNADNTHRPPVVWRISVGLARDGGQLKMSKVDFLQ